MSSDTQAFDIAKSYLNYTPHSTGFWNLSDYVASRYNAYDINSKDFSQLVENVKANITSLRSK